MKKPGILMVIVLAASCAGNLHSQDYLTGRVFDLGGPLTQEPQYFSMTSRLTSFSQDGRPESTDTYELLIMYDPSSGPDSTAGEYRCRQFRLSIGDSVELELPVLAGWLHGLHPEGMDSTGRVFGIDHSLFENIKDQNSDILPLDKRYHVYNTFIDFHSLTSIFALPSSEGGSIRDLTSIGQKTVHYASFSKPPTNLGAAICEGSFFQNGQIVLEFKGMSMYNGRQCALIGFDSGESTFTMILQPVPNFTVTSTGRSRYRGDIYKSLGNNWVQKVTMYETVISATAMPATPEKIYSVVEREIVITNISKKEFHKR